MLMSTREEDLPDLVHRLNIESPAAVGQTATLIKRTQNMFVGPLGELDKVTFDGIIFCADQQNVQAIEEHPGKSREMLHLACGSGKLGSRALRSQLQRVPPFIARFNTIDRAPSLLFACQSGRDLSAGVALAVLCMYYDDSGKASLILHPIFAEIRMKRDDLTIHPHPGTFQWNRPATQDAPITKLLIRQRLAWITTSDPGVNPSRATLQAVHAFLMPRP